MLKSFPSDWGLVSSLKLKGKCPKCATTVEFVGATAPNVDVAKERSIAEIILGYVCPSCSRAIAVRWTLTGNFHGNHPNGSPEGHSPTLIEFVVEDFAYEGAPSDVRAHIDEALKCLAVGAFNGFAAMCRRTVQAISVAIGAERSGRLQAQVAEAVELASLDPEVASALKAVLHNGSDGAHHELPAVDRDRALAILAVLQDVVDQVFNRAARLTRLTQAQAAARAQVAAAKKP